MILGCTEFSIAHVAEAEFFAVAAFFDEVFLFVPVVIVVQFYFKKSRYRLLRLSSRVLEKFFRFLLKLDFGVLRQDPFLQRPSLGQGAQLPFPNFTKQDDADVGAAEMFLRASREGALSDLGDVVLGMHERNLVFKEIIQVLEAQLARQHGLAHLHNGNFWLRGRGTTARAVFIRGFPAEVASGLTTGTEVARGFAMQILWLTVLGIACRSVYKAGIRRYSALGG